MLRVLTYNVHRWLGTDRKTAPGRTAEVIAACEADVVALQEVRLGRSRSGGLDQAEAVAGALGMDLHFQPTVRLMGEQFGLAILTALPSRRIKGDALPLLCEGGLDTARMKTIAVGRSPFKHIEQGRSFCPKVAADMLACARYLEPDLYLRSDLRQCSKSGDFFFLEFNATPTLSRDDDYIKSAELCGLSFETVVARIASQCFNG